MTIILSPVGVSLRESVREVGMEKPEVFPHGPVSFVEVNGLMESLSQGDRLRVLHPATAGGSRYASALSTFFKKHGYPSAVIEVPGFVCSDNDPTERGLRALVSILCGELRAARRQRQPAALYRSEECASVSAYLTLAGEFFQTPVYSFSQSGAPATFVSPQKLTLLLDRHESFFRWLQEERCPTPQVHKRLAQLPHSLTALVGSDNNGFTTLSPLGELCFEAYLSQHEFGK